MSDKCNNNNTNNCENKENMNMVPFVVYGYPMYGMYPGNMGMMNNHFGNMSMGGCGNYMNPVFYTPYNKRPGCCTPTDLEC